MSIGGGPRRDMGGGGVAARARARPRTRDRSPRRATSAPGRDPLWPPMAEATPAPPLRARAAHRDPSPALHGSSLPCHKSGAVAHGVREGTAARANGHAHAQAAQTPVLPSVPSQIWYPTATYQPCSTLDATRLRFTMLSRDSTVSVNLAQPEAAHVPVQQRRPAESLEPRYGGLLKAEYDGILHC